MNHNLAQRLAALSPEKRALLMQIKQKQKSSQTKLPDEEDIAVSTSYHSDQTLTVQKNQVSLADAIGTTPAGQERKAKMRSFYDKVTHQLNTTKFRDEARFLNYGYVANDSPEHSVIHLPTHCLNRNSIKLILELVGDRSLTNQSILDIGCGRGGAISVMTQYFQPRRVVGVDLSESAIAFCQSSVQNNTSITFQVGDAENLPFDDNEFDIITNIESSHCYPDIDKFYHEVYRCLKPGGYFLYTDLLTKQQWTQYKQRLHDLGIILETERDITENVAQSCHQKSSHQNEAFVRGNDVVTMQNFLAMPNSDVYQGMVSGLWQYCILHFRKIK